MIDLFHAFLVQKHELEMRANRTEHLYWDLEPREPWVARAWRWLRALREAAARRRSHRRHASRAGVPGCALCLDAPRGRPTP